MTSVLNDWLDWLPDLLSGLKVSILVSLAILGVGLPLGLLLSLMTSSRLMLVRVTALAIVEVGRGGPALVVLYLVYFGLAPVGLTLSSFVASTVALGFVTGAYASEIFRGAMDAVPRGQTNAVDALGLNYRDGLRYVVLPQALRIAMPPLIGLSILVFQASALTFTVALKDLLARGYDIGVISFSYLSVLTLVGIIYAAVAIPAIWLVGRLSTRLDRHVP